MNDLEKDHYLTSRQGGKTFLQLQILFEEALGTQPASSGFVQAQTATGQPIGYYFRFGFTADQEINLRKLQEEFNNLGASSPLKRSLPQGIAVALEEIKVPVFTREVS